jgi:predicted Zn finger-like uncharacterized protein
MRLICPNCDAQYEVDAMAIPEDGRDVQCSNCGHTWFQGSPELEAERAAEEALFGSVTAAQVAQVAQPVSTRSVAAARDAGQAPSRVWEDDAADPVEEAPQDFPADPAPATADAPPPSAQQMPQPLAAAPLAPRRGMDESLLAVLREEAEREAAVRRAETPRPLEQQTDLGLEETTGAASAAKAVRDRIARLRGPDPAPEEPERPAARRDLLPDIEEINSTLRASGENRAGDVGNLPPPPLVEPKSGSGFRSGFSLMLLLAVLLVVAYVAAPKIVAQFPAAKGVLEDYVGFVNAARIWLDQAMKSAISGLQNLTGSSEG